MRCSVCIRPQLTLHHCFLNLIGQRVREWLALGLSIPNSRKHVHVIFVIADRTPLYAELGLLQSEPPADRREHDKRCDKVVSVGYVLKLSSRLHSAAKGASS